MGKDFGMGDLSSLGFGQVGQMFDGMELMRKTWSAMSLPPGMAPTLSLEELDKRISDLRAVEQWLSLNQNMLRATIQGLEVQRGTIAAVKSFGQAVGSATGGSEKPAIDPDQLAAILASLAHQQASAASGFAMPSAGTPAAAPPPDEVATATPEGDSIAAPTSHTEKQSGKGSARTKKAAELDASHLAQAWWSLLQDQFHQVAEAAISGVGASLNAVGKGDQSSSAEKDAAATTRKPAAKRRKSRTTSSAKTRKPSASKSPASARKRPPRSTR